MISPDSLISRHLCGELGAPRARGSASSGLAAANELGTGVQLNGDGLDPAHGLAAVDRGSAARVMTVGWPRLLKLPLQLETSPSQVQVEAPHWQWA